MNGRTIAETVVRAAVDTGDDHDDLDRIVELVGDARFVLLGEASHGTEEFYRTRELLTRRLIEREGFAGVVAEADWPDAYRVNCYVQGADRDRTADEALGDFERFPAWMWRNTVVLGFIEWLRDRNQAAGGPAVGFYGMDLYSLQRSADAVVRYLESVDPDAASRARERYGCFELFDGDSQAYGSAAAFGAGESCEREVLAQLVELCRRAPEYASGGPVAEDDTFFAEQNARLVVDAERYYRSMFAGRASSWNLRDTHMVDTVDALVDHLGRRRGAPARVVVWAHNSHLGDARATEMGRAGEVNVGQLLRERHPGETFAVGFTTYTGTVTAADDWGGPARRTHVRPGLPGSYEELLHDVGRDRFLLAPGLDEELASALRAPRLERAIGVIYRPRTERRSHYFEASLADQFDAVVHVDATTALRPLEPGAGWIGSEAPETYPTSL